MKAMLGRMSSSARFRRLTRSPFVRAGLPMMIFIVVSFAGLQKFVQGKKELEDLSRGRRTLTTREYDLEEDYKKTMKKLNPEYELKHIPKRD
jgi:Cytochrome c oxidase assembly protein COX16